MDTRHLFNYWEATQKEWKKKIVKSFLSNNARASREESTTKIIQSKMKYTHDTYAQIRTFSNYYNNLKIYKKN
jgi:hypothetical protein